MSTPILATKLHIPPPRPQVVLRPRLIERLNEGLHRKLTLISAPAGFGKTTLVGEWVAGCQRPVAWLSLDEGDNDPSRFLAYLVAALRTLALPSPGRGSEVEEPALSGAEGVAANIGEGVLSVLQSPQPPPPESILTALLNEITTLPGNFILVLDDYHLIEAKPVDHALTFMIEHLPPQMQLVIATREDPQLPLARLRARGQLTELRASDLRFTSSEAAEFLNQVMGLNLLAEDIAALETRTEGWIAGLQLAAISMQGHKDATGFIKSFTGSHHFVLDYLVEEVLHQQPESVQTFLLRTSILDRLCGPLCDALLTPDSLIRTPLGSGADSQSLLEYLEHANLFIVPLDDERRWYRYHHLFADLLRQRLHQSAAPSPPSPLPIPPPDRGRGPNSLPPIGGGAGSGSGASVAELHRRASVWYEDNGLEIEAFQHAAAANDIERAARLVEGEGMPLLFLGAVGIVLHWLESLPAPVLDARPSLWVIYASALLFVGQLAGVEQKVQAAEAALASAHPDDKTRDLIGHIASIRATLAVTQHQVESIVAQSRRALEYLHPHNLPVRTATTWTLGYAFHLQGDRAAARQAYTEALAASQAIGHFIITFMATLGLGGLQEAENQLNLAAQTYRRALQLVGDPPLPVACEAHLGLARISYAWNDLAAAQQHGQHSLQLARQIENIDRPIASQVFLARLKLAQGDAAGAAAILAEADQFVRQHNFVHQMPEVAAAQVLTLLHQGNLAAAAHLAQAHELPISRARVHLAQGDPAAALAALEPFRQQAEAKGWQDETLKVMVLQAVAHHARGEKDQALQRLGGALALAEPGGFIRIFVDEGIPMAQLLLEAAARGIMPDYTRKLLGAFEDATKDERRRTEDERRKTEAVPSSFVLRPSSLIEPLSQRELQVLQLIAQGLSNREISQRLFLALSTVKGHNRIIFDKLQVQRRTEAVARARELGLL